MINFTQGNLLDAKVDALVNTVNTVGVMGKGIALMFKERYPINMHLYARACKQKDLRTGKMFVTETNELSGPKWIINFPTKNHWKGSSKIEWIEDGLDDLRKVILDNSMQSVAIPPLGAGNGGLNWPEVKAVIEEKLSDLPVNIIVYEPTTTYQNVAKKTGVKKLTPARALVAEMIKSYWVMGIDCSMLEAQKLAYFLNKAIDMRGIDNPLKLHFKAHNFGPYSPELPHLLNALDGVYLHAEKRISDSQAFDPIWFDRDQKDVVSGYLNTEAKTYIPALNLAKEITDGFQSPFGMELLATVDWILAHSDVDPTVEGIKNKLAEWPAGKKWADRKLRFFNDRSIEIALQRLVPFQQVTA